MGRKRSILTLCRKEKNLRPIILFLLICLFSCSNAYAAGDKNSFHKNYPIRQEKIIEGGVFISRPNTFDKTVFDAINLYKIRTLEAYSQWLDGQLTYAGDGIFDKWAPPEETFRRKKGDCEDYAILNLIVLRKLGFETRFVGLFRKEGAHAICVVKQNGYYSWFDNAVLKRTEARTLKELGKLITKEYAYSRVSEYNVSSKTWDVIYDKNKDNPATI